MRSLKIHAILLSALCVACLTCTPAATAHPMGNFAICHYARLQADPSDIRIHYVIDMAEIPALSEKEALDADHNGIVSPAEKSAYLTARTAQLLSGVTLTVNGTPEALTFLGSKLRLSPGAGGLETLKITLDWSAATPSGPRDVSWEDRNYPSRTGWKEIVAANGDGVALSGASAYSVDRSRGLSIYPRDLVPPQDTEAHFSAAPGTAAASADPSAPAATRDATPRDLFTQAIARRTLTPGIMLAGLLIAFVFGSFHALSPGHGKTMVAAYLVGSRGNARHAVTLGLIVTITHTLGVFALGLVTLFASRYIVPEKLYPVLSAISGLAVFGVGVWLLISRLRGLPTGHHHTHGHDHADGPDEIPLHTESQSHDHSHDHGARPRTGAAYPRHPGRADYAAFSAGARHLRWDCSLPVSPGRAAVCGRPAPDCLRYGADYGVQYWTGIGADCHRPHGCFHAALVRALSCGRRTAPPPAGGQRRRDYAYWSHADYPRGHHRCLIIPDGPCSSSGGRL